MPAIAAGYPSRRGNGRRWERDPIVTRDEFVFWPHFTHNIKTVSMKNQHFRQYSFVIALAFILSLGFVGTAVAAQSSSPSYSVNEVQMGGVGSSLHDCSANYCAKTSVGDTSVGRASSANYSAQLGFNTSDEPMLEVIVEGGNQNMGVLDTSTTGTALATIKVRNYLSNGYVLQITGVPPSQGTHTLTTLSTPSTSQQGAEQFGINLADNTAPNIGAGPVQVPSGTFSFGTVADGTDGMDVYNQPDLFMYKDGDIVARSLKSTGETDYTMSMIINVSNVTPGGQYTGTFSAVAVPIF